MHFFTQESVIIDTHILVKKNLMMDLFLRNTALCFTKHQLMDWSGVDYLWIIAMLLSAVWTLILTAPIHCRGSIGEQLMECYMSPNRMKKTNSSTS